jgi:hypothetical protein
MKHSSGICFVCKDLILLEWMPFRFPSPPPEPKFNQLVAA